MVFIFQGKHGDPSPLPRAKFSDEELGKKCSCRYMGKYNTLCVSSAR